MPAKGRRVHHDERAMMLVGTSKGVFFYESDFERLKWKRTGPYLADQAIPSIVYDHRDRKSVYVATAASGLHRTRDQGRTWERIGAGLPVPGVTHVTLGHLSEPGTLWVGLEGGRLARSADSGQNFAEVPGFARVSSDPAWWGRAGTPVVTSIVVHPSSPRSLHVAINVGGVFRSDDGGETWTACNQGLVPSDLMRLVSNAAKPERLYAASHAGVFRTDDGGDTWVDVGAGLKSRVTRSIVVSPSKPGTVFVVPLAASADKGEPRIDGALTVYRSTDGGDHWDALTEGLPERIRATVHREAMRIDTLDEEGVYLATSDGSIVVSLDDGENWTQVVSGLSPALSIETITEQE